MNLLALLPVAGREQLLADRNVRASVWLWLSCVAALGAWFSLTASAGAGKLDAASLAQSAKVTTDSSFPGYGPAVLTDGRWYAKGEENPSDYTSTRLGNGGNAWAASETPGEHWICLEWPQPVTLDEVEIWW